MASEIRNVVNVDDVTDALAVLAKAAQRTRHKSRGITDPIEAMVLDTIADAQDLAIEIIGGHAHERSYKVRITS